MNLFNYSADIHSKCAVLYLRIIVRTCCVRMTWGVARNTNALTQPQSY